jgi:hypothetical protein
MRRGEGAAVAIPLEFHRHDPAWHLGWISASTTSKVLSFIVPFFRGERLQ